MPWHPSLTSYTDGVSIPVASELNEYLDNMNYLRSPATDGYAEPQGTDFTTTSTTWASISSDFEITIDTEDCLLFILFSATIHDLHIDIELDGTRIGNTSTGEGSAYSDLVLSRQASINLPYIASVSAGTHTVKAMWKFVGGGSTGTINNSQKPRLYVRELK